MELWWKIIKAILESSSNDRSLAWMFMAILTALTAFLLALNPVLSHFK
jgi:hypothetical protein